MWQAGRCSPSAALMSQQERDMHTRCGRQLEGPATCSKGKDPEIRFVFQGQRSDKALSIDFLKDWRGRLKEKLFGKSWDLYGLRV
jgi:hypothetical protein